jgi:hypothetical protein
MDMASGAINWTRAITIGSLAILVGTELVGIAWASGWAIAALFQLGDTAGLVFQGVFAIAALAILYALVRQAVRIEPIRS